MIEITFNSMMDESERSQTVDLGVLTTTQTLKVTLQSAMTPSYVALVGAGWLPTPTQADEGGDMVFTFQFPPNLSDAKSAWIQFADESLEVFYYITLSIAATPIFPLWEDKNLLAGVTTSPIAIGLSQWGGGSDLYKFVSTKKPGAAEQEAYLNDVIAQFFSRSLPSLPSEGDGLQLTDAALLKNIAWYDIAQSSEQYSAIFKNDWSYNREGLYTTNEPIRSEIGKRQVLLSTILDAGYKGSIVFYDAQGANLGAMTIPSTYSSQGADLAVWISDILALKPTAAKMVVGGVVYNIVDDNCYTHALYYLNAYGGWDSLLIKGISKKKDVYERKTMQRTYRNNTPEARGLYNYANGVTTEWILVSGWLSDEEAARMHHLLGSTSVYMMDLYTGEISPIVLTNSECEFKTYRNTGLQMVSYEITATYAQDKMRR